MLPQKGATVHDFVGRGWSFPLGVTANGTIATAGGARKLEQAMSLVLSTYPGERPFRPAFGSKLRDFVYESASAVVFARIEQEVRESLSIWEPRTEVSEVRVHPAPDSEHLLLIDITYVIKGENDQRNLVHPFYTIPDEGSD
ncbi:GPW/gp25 family protein [Amycolatopsis magusensis]|uniref:Phage baseplate assembly protein W n=1 Tax=Amycolatopsis magusensis TaxID=882444 RepID=A0ABS4PV69_9PSEU|nr:GPW/gp25 family protein [Amycolatopsis magusensis]MBP2182738.1 phage baseplate assembly protein W [Amycolatopsis magusensis]MDI5982738.1 GPW/gp25 family protein [Amycolatopsis magusensis]